MSTIAFIGLGNMGLPMAINLKNAGYEVVGFDVVDSAREAAVQAGINVSDNAQFAVQDSDVTVTIVVEVADRVSVALKCITFNTGIS